MDRTRAAVLVVTAAAVIAAGAVPVLAADPSPKPSKPPKAEKGPETSISLTGTVRATTGENGRTEYTVTSGGTTWTLDAGPSWWFGGSHPLAGVVGSSVSIVGTTRAGSTDLDVETIDGKVLRQPGKPPWAGGPKAVGEKHPGWKAWKAARGEGKAPGFMKRFGTAQPGRATAPGQLKPKPSAEAGD